MHVFSLILPPIIVVVALAILLFLFFRKLPEMERKEAEISSSGTISFDSITDRLKRFFLGIIEWIARWFKLISLKIHNKLNTVASTARNARLQLANRAVDRNKNDTIKTHKADDVVDDIVGEEVADFKKDIHSGSAVSEPVEPDPLVVEKENTRFRQPHSISTSVNRRSGAVKKLRVPKRVDTPSVIKREEKAPIKKDQLEDILVERISLNPRDVEAYERLGDYYLEQRNLVDAKECYRQVLKLSPAYRLVKIKIRRLERLLEKERTM